MSSLHGILGQLAPVAGVLAPLYTGPGNKHATVRIVVCNRGSVDLFRVAVSPNGAPIDSAHYMAYDMVIGANDSLGSAPFTVHASDIVRVHSTNGNCSFTLTGIEEDG